MLPLWTMSELVLLSSHRLSMRIAPQGELSPICMSTRELALSPTTATRELALTLACAVLAEPQTDKLSYHTGLTSGL